jgi:hypothetical protein
MDWGAMPPARRRRNPAKEDIGEQQQRQPSISED